MYVRMYVCMYYKYVLVIVDTTHVRTCTSMKTRNSILSFCFRNMISIIMYTHLGRRKDNCFINLSHNKINSVFTYYVLYNYLHLHVDTHYYYIM